MNKQLSDINIKEARENFIYKDLFYYLIKVLKNKDIDFEKDFLTLVEQNATYTMMIDYRNEVNRLLDREIERE